MPAESAITRTRRLFIISGYVVIALAFLVIGAIPYVRGVAAVEAGIIADRNEIEAREASKKQLEQVRTQLQLVNLQVRNHDRLLPPNQDLGPFMEQLSHELDNVGMREITVRQLPAITLGKSQQLPIEIGGTCTFAQFHDFLIRLENLPRMSSVSRLSVEADSAMTGKVVVSLQLSIYNTKPAS